MSKDGLKYGEMKMATKAKFKVPKSLATCADTLYNLRQERLAIQKQADEIEEKEKELKLYIINTLGKDNATGVSGMVANVKVVVREEPTAADWDAFYAYIHKNKAYHLLNRAVNKASVKEILESGKKIPGIALFNVVTVSLTKV